MKSRMIQESRELFALKLQDYGASWRVMRISTVIDLLYIKAKRIATIQATNTNYVGESEKDGVMAIINYCIIGIIQLRLGYSDKIDKTTEEILPLYDSIVAQAQHPTTHNPIEKRLFEILTLFI